jgi:hypothetical protein
MHICLNVLEGRVYAASVSQRRSCSVSLSPISWSKIHNWDSSWNGCLVLLARSYLSMQVVSSFLLRVDWWSITEAGAGYIQRSVPLPEIVRNCNILLSSGSYLLSAVSGLAQARPKCGCRGCSHMYAPPEKCGVQCTLTTAPSNCTVNLYTCNYVDVCSQSLFSE